ncbi:MAG TPA: AbrB/MazE/SpoVT family DNA-binding domain-containing protein [Spirochaetota bacterium]|nr:AbrB/MazE/SpoVT family DNA-binding domain-containing protein [Spirochaetota bacterium]
MPYSTLTGQGHITIPKVVRDNLNLKTGDTLYFRLEKSEIKIIPVSNSIEDAYGLLARKRQKKISIDDMNKKLKKAIINKNR